MDLLVDIGNSRIKWALSAEGKLTATQGQQPHQDINPSDLCCEMWGNVDRPERVIVASVGSSILSNEVINWSLKNWGVTPNVVRPVEKGWGVTNGYNSPESLGVDRWLSLVAARKKWNNKAVFIADCGTAVTIDVLGADGAHRGGLIVPGLSMMRESLMQRTAGIAMSIADSKRDHALLASDTKSAVMGGTLYTLVSVLDRTIHDVGVEMNQSIFPVITGGDAMELQALLRVEFTHVPNLVLEGLALVAGLKP